MIATAWIESHQALGHHPKTLRLANALKCSVPAAVGHLQFLWWWALDYAPDGVVALESKPVIAQACWWKGRPEVFWDSLVDAGFVEDCGAEQVLKIHDWMDYAGRIVARRESSRERARKWRTERAPNAHDNAERTHTERAPNAASRAGIPTNQPTGDSGAVSLTNQPPNPLVTDAAAPGGPDVAPPRAAAPHQDESPPQVLHPGVTQCPLCPLLFSGSYDEHLRDKHKVRATAEPGNLNFGSKLRRDSEPEPPPPDVAAQFAAMHQRLQELEHQPQAEVNSC